MRGGLPLQTQGLLAVPTTLLLLPLLFPLVLGLPFQTFSPDPPPTFSSLLIEAPKPWLLRPSLFRAAFLFFAARSSLYA